MYFHDKGTYFFGISVKFTIIILFLIGNFLNIIHSVMKNTINLVVLTSVLLAGMLLSGCKKEEQQNVPGTVFTAWPEYSPTIYYDFDQDYPDFTMPTTNLPYTPSKVAWTRSYEWWSFFAGSDANSLVTEEAVIPMLKRLNKDFGYIRDQMGWPPDLPARNGFRSAVFLYGSGVIDDGASNTDKGGWQSAVTIYGVTYPMILASYYPVYCFDPTCAYSDTANQRSAMVHEGIHAIFSSMPGKNKKSWFHEGCNCWLQATMELERKYGQTYTSTSFGWLSMGSILAPFIPIECYSGWLKDGSFGGPDAEGVSSNYRKVIGGMQYSEVFPTFMGETLGKHSLPWIWQNCTGHVLEGIGGEIGKDQMRRLIQEYRAKLCLADLGRYSHAVQNMYQSYMGSIILSDVAGVDIPAWKATPYASMTEGDDGWLVPDDLTLPGWTGANIIPIVVDGDELTVSFKPNGTLSTSENMSCQLCYRTADGTTVYGEPFYDGSFTMKLDENVPVDNIVFAVVCNLDYVFTSTIRKNHYDYRLKLSKNAKEANIYKSYFSSFVLD
jgi:hypothetical protein